MSVTTTSSSYPSSSAEEPVHPESGGARPSSSKDAEPALPERGRSSKDLAREEVPAFVRQHLRESNITEVSPTINPWLANWAEANAEEQRKIRQACAQRQAEAEATWAEANNPEVRQVRPTCAEAEAETQEADKAKGKGKGSEAEQKAAKAKAKAPTTPPKKPAAGDADSQDKSNFFKGLFTNSLARKCHMSAIFDVVHIYVMDIKIQK